MSAYVPLALLSFPGRNLGSILHSPHPRFRILREKKMQSSLSVVHRPARTCYADTSRINGIARRNPISRKHTSVVFATLKLSKPQENSQFPKPVSLFAAKPKGSLICGNSSNSFVSGDGGGCSSIESNASVGRNWIEAVGDAISTAFPLWVAIGCLLGLLKPGSYSWVQPKWTIMGITLTMLGMGMTLTFDDLRGALAMPKELFTGFVLQYSV